MIALTIDNADGFVSKLQRKGVDVRWDGWKMIFFREDKGATRNPAGRRIVRNTPDGPVNVWGFEKVISPNKQGKWLVGSHLTRA
jgi:hypothetical protein